MAEERVIVLRRHDDGRVTVENDWPQTIELHLELLLRSMVAGGTVELRVRFEVDNGHAEYRIVGQSKSAGNGIVLHATRVRSHKRGRLRRWLIGGAVLAVFALIAFTPPAWWLQMLRGHVGASGRRHERGAWENRLGLADADAIPPDGEQAPIRCAGRRCTRIFEGTRGILGYRDHLIERHRDEEFRR